MRKGVELSMLCIPDTRRKMKPCMRKVVGHPYPDVGLKKVTIASMSGVPKFNTFQTKGVVEGQRATVLIDGGASHNFINMAMVERKHIPTIDLEGFLVEVAGERTIACDRHIPQMSLTLGRYTLIQDFYVVDIPDTNIILGVQWLSYLGANHH
jgi:hypothetical protein